MTLLCHLTEEPTVRGILSSTNTVALTNAQLEVRSRGIEKKIRKLFSFSECSDIEHVHGGKCYFLSEIAKPWRFAEEHCSQLGV